MLSALKRHTRDIFIFNKFAVYGWPWPFQTTLISFRRRALHKYMGLYSTFKFKNIWSFSELFFLNKIVNYNCKEQIQRLRVDLMGNLMTSQPPYIIFFLSQFPKLFTYFILVQLPSRKVSRTFFIDFRNRV